VLAAAAGAGCGAESSATTPCALDRRAAEAVQPVGATSGAPAGSELVNSALRKAQRADSVHFRVTARFEVDVPESYLRSLQGGEEMLELARQPLCVVLEGERSAAGFRATARVESEGTVKKYELRQASGHFYLRVRGRWFDFHRPFGRFFDTETFGALIPGEACVQEESEGCDRVDFGSPLEDGRLGHLIDGEVGARDDVWQLSGRLDAREFSEFNEAAPPSTYEPFARKGEIVFSAGKVDGLPRQFDFRYDLDRADIEAHGRSSAGEFTRRRGHVNMVFSRWGEPVRVSPPAAAGVTNAVIGEIVGGILRAAYLHH
jgi:hypothetical protein